MLGINESAMTYRESDETIYADSLCRRDSLKFAWKRTSLVISTLLRKSVKAFCNTPFSFVAGEGLVVCPVFICCFHRASTCPIGSIITQGVKSTSKAKKILTVSDSPCVSYDRQCSPTRAHRTTIIDTRTCPRGSIKQNCCGPDFHSATDIGSAHGGPVRCVASRA